MLCEIYIEALPIDEELADQVWQLWAESSISDSRTALACWLLATRPGVR